VPGDALHGDRRIVGGLLARQAGEVRAQVQSGEHDGVAAPRGPRGPGEARLKSVATTGPMTGSRGYLPSGYDVGMEAGGKAKWARIAIWLVVTTLAYNVIEAVIALWAGARADSIALLGFGLDSVIECAAATVLLWRLSVETRDGDADEVERAERKVHRFVGATFLALALYIALEASHSLRVHEVPAASIAGIALGAASLVVMPLVSWAKLRAAAHIGSPALRSEAKETLACAILSLTLLVGLVANSAAGWWWADPVAALLMVPWLLKEGIEGLRAEEAGED
jgi:divalent metal cation (Fe/Co/Zn/Cd) transporter